MGTYDASSLVGQDDRGEASRAGAPLGANTFTSVRVATPQGLDVLQLLASQSPTLRRVPNTASSSFSRALTCLPQTVKREQTCDSLARFLLCPRMAMVARTRGEKATRSSRNSSFASTAYCRYSTTWRSLSTA